MTALFPFPLSYARTNQNKLLPFKRRSPLSCKSSFFVEKGELRRLSSVKRTIRFCPVVSVVTIPNRMDYTNWERENLWTSEEDQIRDKKRNKIEFAYENGDWREVNEEQDFIFVRGQWIHPVHVCNAYRRLQKRLEMELSLQK
jgi:hypothetical protein